MRASEYEGQGANLDDLADRARRTRQEEHEVDNAKEQVIRHGVVNSP
jgi:hypothetical protein